jgi:hypothetical protein
VIKKVVTYIELSTHYARFLKTPFFCGLMLALNERYPEFQIPSYSINILKKVPQKPLDNNFYVAYLQVKGESKYGPQELLDQAYDIYDNYQNSFEEEEDNQMEDPSYNFESPYNDNNYLIQNASTPFYEQEDMAQESQDDETKSPSDNLFLFDTQKEVEVEQDKEIKKRRRKSTSTRRRRQQYDIQ